MLDVFINFIKSSAFVALDIKTIIMLVISFFLMYLAIVKKFEPLLLIPISFGMLLANVPFAGMMDPPTENQFGGVLYYLYQGVELGVFPPLVFMGIGAMTDFGPLISNPKSLFLGAAAQFGIFVTFIGAIASGAFTAAEGASIAIIGGANGPAALYLTSLLAPHLLGSIAIAAYSYMALVPVIQPPIMMALTSKEERMIKMKQMRVVSQKEKIIFPIMVTLLVSLIVPASTPLVGMLMLGNLFKEALIVDKLRATASDAIMYTVTIFLGLTIGATANAEQFLSSKTILIMILGVVAFSFGTAMG
ncbi:MAG TPA: sodium ion-translocating decarboxylase subunit beta, partial [Clostridia bacterium]|nr:sodium ion-translocating decarboxylase subunit beta [Clostridia bacterium]